MSHVVYRDLLREKGDEGLFLEEEMTSIAKRVLRIPSGSASLISVYRKRLQNWFISVGLIVAENGSFRLQTHVSSAALLQNTLPHRHMNAHANFLGAAPPHKALEALRTVLANPLHQIDAEHRPGRNALAVLVSLGILDSADKLCACDETDIDAEILLRSKANSQSTIQFVINALSCDSSLKAVEVGNMVAKAFGYSTWSVASFKRYGSALSIWARWAAGQIVRCRLASS
jgi:hypothetical protein